TGDTYCLGCGVKIASGSAIPATGNHTWDNGVVTLEPTYTAPGVRTYTCTVCDATRTEEIAQLESVYVDDDKSAVMEDVGLVAVAGNTVTDFLANASDGTVILDRDGKEMKPDAIPGTGATLVLPDGTEHTIVVLGDINGDGRVLAGDARLALRSAVGLENLMDAYYAAADVDNIAQISVADARLILRASVHLEDPADWFETAVQ
ncbi:MAG: dockerin type I repeat-containing protein, partial [Clostridia bacterium]|nr:dockerin type I repeat-containing protein [Clostridia bacterium]